MTEYRAGLFGTESGTALALAGVEVKAEVVAGHASATVRQRYRNLEGKAIEAIYTFPLPSKSVLTKFAMTVEGRRLEGEVHEREEAFRRYDDAIAAGHGGALLEQERPNVFTANVGNLLPGEETIIEIQYVEPLVADEGAVRWSIPTLVAPRYVPGVPVGDRTAHGTAEPTDRVPDADRISPPIADSGAVPYGLVLDLLFDLGVTVEVTSPSHPITARSEGSRTRVSFAQSTVALDRDVVVVAAATATVAAATPIAQIATHKVEGADGYFALALVPDLAAGGKREGRSDVVFVLDRSGSMGGASMSEARTALRLCLRQLREGDRFNILAFDDSVESFKPQMVPFTQATLKQADTWLGSIDARGGTELLVPLVTAAKLAPDGVVVLLTDGEVGNEAEILSAFMATRMSARVYSFGIGTNVSDVLLQDLAERTGGAVEMIYPGERVDEKVVAQFARATAARVTDVTIKARGVELSELAPAEPRPLVDGEVYTVFGRYEAGGHGAVEIRGRLDGASFFLEIPVDLDATGAHEVVGKLWAQARIRDLERTQTIDGRRAESLKSRIVKIAVDHGVSSKHTSFVVVEKRIGDRRMNAQPEARVIPVAAPAGWDMMKKPKAARRRQPLAPGAMPMMARGIALPPPAPARGTGGAPLPAPPARRGGAALPPPVARSAASPASRPMPASRGMDDMVFRSAPPTLKEEAASEGDAAFSDLLAAKGFVSADAPPDHPAAALASAGLQGMPLELTILSQQAASGLWEDMGRDPIESTASALVQLWRQGLSTSHPIYGAQVKKAVEALLERLKAASAPAAARELALAVAWLLATGRRTRVAIENQARGDEALAALAAALGDEDALKAHVDRLAPA